MRIERKNVGKSIKIIANSLAVTRISRACLNMIHLEVRSISARVVNKRQSETKGIENVETTAHGSLYLL